MPRFSKISATDVVKLRQAGMTFQDIAKELHGSKDTIIKLWNSQQGTLQGDTIPSTISPPVGGTVQDDHPATMPASKPKAPAKWHYGEDGGTHASPGPFLTVKVTEAELYKMPAWIRERIIKRMAESI